MPIEISLDINGDVQLKRALLIFSKRTKDARPAFRAMATMLRQDERKQFTSGGKYASGGWLPLKPATIKAKQRKKARGEAKYTRAILRETGALMDSLTRKADPGHVELVEPHQLVFGTQTSYAKYHQLGRGVPRRRPVELRAQDRRQLVKILQRYLVTGKVREPSSRTLLRKIVAEYTLGQLASRVAAAAAEGA